MRRRSPLVQLSCMAVVGCLWLSLAGCIGSRPDPLPPALRATGAPAEPRATLPPTLVAVAPISQAATATPAPETVNPTPAPGPAMAGTRPPTATPRTAGPPFLPTLLFTPVPPIKFQNKEPIVIEWQTGVELPKTLVKVLCIEAETERCPAFKLELIGLNGVSLEPPTPSFDLTTKSASAELRLPTPLPTDLAGELVLRAPGVTESLAVSIKAAKPTKPTIVARPEKIELAVTGVGPLTHCEWPGCLALLNMAFKKGDTGRLPQVNLDLVAAANTLDPVEIGASTKLSWLTPDGLSIRSVESWPQLTVVRRSGESSAANQLPLQNTLILDPQLAASTRYDTRLVFVVNSAPVTAPVTVQVRDPRGYGYLMLVIGIVLALYTPGLFSRVQRESHRWTALRTQGETWAGLNAQIQAFLNPASTFRPGPVAPRRRLKTYRDPDYLLGYASLASEEFAKQWQAATRQGQRRDYNIGDLQPSPHPALSMTEATEWATLMADVETQVKEFIALYRRAERVLGDGIEEVIPFFNAARPATWDTTKTEIATKIDDILKLGGGRGLDEEEKEPGEEAAPPTLSRKGAREFWQGLGLFLAGALLVLIDWASGPVPLGPLADVSLLLTVIGLGLVGIGWVRMRRAIGQPLIPVPDLLGGLVALLLAVGLGALLVWSLTPDSSYQFVGWVWGAGMALMYGVVWALGIPSMIANLRRPPKTFVAPLGWVSLVERLWPAAAILIIGLFAVMSLESKTTFGKVTDYIEALLWGAGMQFTAKASDIVKILGLRKTD